MPRLLALFVALTICVAGAAVPAVAQVPPPGGASTGGTITGVAYAPDGVTPAPNLTVMACRGAASCFASANSGSDGSFTLINVATDSDNVQAFPPYNQQGWFKGSGGPIVVTAGATISQNVRLIQGVRASGTVFEPDALTPVPAGTSVIHRVGFESMGVSTGADGRYVTGWLQPGGALTITAGPSYIGTKASVDHVTDDGGVFLSEGDQPVIDLTLMGGGAWLEGTITGDGTMLQNARVSVQSAMLSEMTGPSGTYRTRAMVVADPAAPTTVNVSPPPFVNFIATTRSVNLVPGSNRLDVDLAEGGILTGTVTNFDGTPAAGGFPAACQGPLSCQFGQILDGRYRISGLATGTYTLKVTKSGSYPPVVAEVTGLSVVAPFETVQDVTFPEGTADTTPPTITLYTPPDGAVYRLGDLVTASFYCSDPSGVTLCQGTTASGSAIDTATTGAHTFGVRAQDAPGNFTERLVSYTVVDTAPPTLTGTAPVGGASYSLGQVVVADYTCSDPSGVTRCDGTVPSGSPVPTSTAGDHTFQVVTEDVFGNTATPSLTYTVLAGNVTANLAGSAGVVTTDPGGVGATTDVPLQTSIAVPAGVDETLTVTPRDTPTSTTEPGFSLFGEEVVLSGPDLTPTGTFYEVTFTVESTVLQGISPADVQVFRDGDPVAACTDPAPGVMPAPNPCIVSRGSAGDGDALVTVRTTKFSTWNLGRLDYDLTGPLQPLVAAPTLNTARAGSTIPVKFSLGGDKGLDVLAAGYPKISTLSCGSGAIEQTATANSSTLSLDAVSGRYSYSWKTTTAMKGCQALVLRFRDGTELRVLFRLR